MCCGKLTLLGQEQAISLLQRHPMSRVLVVGRKSRRVRRLGHFTGDHLVQGVDALAIGIEGIHEMHAERLFAVGNDCEVWESGLGPLA
jgi:hypothetical protein